MASCKLAGFLYQAVPSQRFRDFLIRRHMERCAECQARLISRNEARLLFVRPENLACPEDLWRRIGQRFGAGDLAPAKAITEAEGRGARRRLWAWAAGAAVFLVTSAVSFWLLRGTQAPGVRVDYVRPTDRIEINYINVGGAPAQAFIYRPQGSDIIVVWAERNP